MKRFIVEKLPAQGRPVPLSPEESRHALQVFRLQDGDAVEAIDGTGGACGARIRVGREVVLEFTGTGRAIDPASQVVPVTVELAVLKGDAMADAIQKCVELGASRLVPLLTEFTVVSLKGKGEGAFLARWRKIADQSLKQCGRLERLAISDPIELELLPRAASGEAAFFCDEDAASEGGAPPMLEALAGLKPSTPVRLAIGPEGGWSDRDRDLLARSGRRPVTLGPLVLRADTAVAFAVSLCAAHARA